MPLFIPTFLISATNRNEISITVQSLITPIGKFNKSKLVNLTRVARFRDSIKLPEFEPRFVLSSLHLSTLNGEQFNLFENNSIRSCQYLRGEYWKLRRFQARKYP